MSDPVATPAPAADPAAAPAADPKTIISAADPAPAPTPAPAPAADPAPAPADPAPAAKGAWPEDWQRRMAGDDEAELKQVARYASPEAIWKKSRELEKKMSSGEVKTVLPKDAKPEELAAWRKENGIPEAPEKYDLGLKVPDADKEVIGAFLKSAHAANMTPAQAKTAVEAYYAQRQMESQARATKDVEHQASALDTLNQEWGGQFRRNINLIDGMLAKFPEKVRDAVKAARLPDGTLLFNSPDAARGFLTLALELNPAGIVVPAVGGDLGKSALDEYKEIQKLMRENRKNYDRDAGKQKRMVELIEYLRNNDLIDAQGNEIVQRKKAA